MIPYPFQVHPIPRAHPIRIPLPNIPSHIHPISTSPHPNPKSHIPIPHSTSQPHVPTPHPTSHIPIPNLIPSPSSRAHHPPVHLIPSSQSQSHSPDPIPYGNREHPEAPPQPLCPAPGLSLVRGSSGPFVPLIGQRQLRPLTGQGQFRSVRASHRSAAAPAFPGLTLVRGSSGPFVPLIGQRQRRRLRLAEAQCAGKAVGSRLSPQVVPVPQPLRAGAVRAAPRRNCGTTGAVLRTAAPEPGGTESAAGPGREPCAAVSHLRVG